MSEYEYPSEFELKDDLREAIIQLGLHYEDFGEDVLDLSEASSGYGFGDILSYDFQEKEAGINLTAVLGVEQDGSNEYIKQMKLNVELVKNPYSCFDGYSIKSLTAENITPFIEEDGLEHTFYGSDTYFEEEAVFALEFAYAEDDLNYGQFVYIDLSGNEELADYVRENAGSDFKVTYRLDDSNSSLIEEVVPMKIEAVENGIGAE